MQIYQPEKKDLVALKKLGKWQIYRRMKILDREE